MKNSTLFYLTTVLLICFSLKISAQQIDPKNTEWMQYLEELTASEEENLEQIEILFDELSYLSENPIHLNQTNQKELQRLPFLSPIQIENLLYHIYKFGPLVDIYELKNVESIDFQTLTYLLPFVYISDLEVKNTFDWKNIFTQTKQEVIFRSDYTFQEKAGYKKAPTEEIEENPNKYYLGEPYYLSLRYNFQHKDLIQFGLSTEKDAGESFWNKYHKGFDFYTFNLNIRNIGILKSLHLGNYRIAFGQGLVMNTNFSMRQTSDVTNIEQKNNGIRRHVSTSESNYFSGIAGTLSLKNTDIDLFYSQRNWDANADSLNIYTFKTDGYHRVPNDLNKRKMAKVNTMGIHSQWRNEDIIIGGSFVAYDFGGKTFNPEYQPYNHFYLRDKNFFNAGIHYGYYHRRFSFAGETAIDKNQKVATLNHLSISPSSKTGLVISYRHYAKDYNAFYGNAFGESSAVRNEQGLYSGVYFYPSSSWNISLSFDVFYFPWLRYGVNSPSKGSSLLADIQYRRNKQLKFLFRYRFKEKEKNRFSETGRETFILPYQQHRFRLQTDYEQSQSIHFRTQLDYNIYSEKEDMEMAWSITQQMSKTLVKPDLQISGAIGYFHTDSWNTRISIYEKNILYAFSFPNYYGKGLRSYFFVRFKPIKALSIYLKLSNTHYFDRIKIGSGLEEIEGYNKTELNISIKYNF